MEISDWVTYISRHLSLQPPEFTITKLEGGIINSTVRLTLSQPRNSIPGSPRTWDPPIQSCVLKHAPPHMPRAPDQPLSIFRQTVEAQALQYFQDHPETLGARGEMEVPQLVLHDVENTVLWMTDLGRMSTLTDYFHGEPYAPTDKLGEERVAEIIGRSIGEALARLHVATLHPSPDALSRWTDPAKAKVPTEEQPEDVADHLRVLARKLMQDFVGVSADEAETLSKRIGMDTYILDPGEKDERALTMGDLWPGSILLSSTEKESVKMALVDWEFFNAYHPGRDLAMLLAHFRTHQLEAQYPSDSPLAVHADPDMIKRRTDKASVALWEAYRPIMLESTNTKRWKREALQSWGREMIVVAGDFRREIISDEGMTICIKEGVACLRAAGTATGKEETQWLEGAPEMLRMIL